MINTENALKIVNEISHKLDELRVEVISEIAKKLISKSKKIKNYYDKNKDYYDLLVYTYANAIDADAVIVDTIKDILEIYYLNHPMKNINTDIDKWYGKFKLPKLPIIRLSSLQASDIYKEYRDMELTILESYKDDEEVELIFNKISNMKYLGMYHYKNYEYFFVNWNELYVIGAEITKKGKILSSIEVYKEYFDCLFDE